MNFVKLYSRVLGLLGPEARLGWLLAVANVALAAAQFAEPVLFGRIIDTLVQAQAANAPPDIAALTPLLAAWVGFGLFTIGCSVLVALHADRLVAPAQAGGADRSISSTCCSCRSSFHGGTHSGRLMKVMLTGVDALWATVAVVLPRAFRRLRGAVRAAAAVAVRQLAARLRCSSSCAWSSPALTALVMYKTDTLQRTVESHYTALAERTSDALGNIALVQGFARVEAEVSSLRDDGRPPARRADAGAVLVGDDRGADPRLDHDHDAVDLPARHLPATSRASRPSARSSPS